MPTKSVLQAKLADLKAASDAGLISATEFAASKASLLGIAPALPPSQGADAVTTLEDPNSRAKRETVKIVGAWIGSRETPWLGGELWDVLFNGTPDERLRHELTKKATESPFTKRLVAVFRNSGKGVTPEEIKGSELARLAAREFLRDLAASLCASQVATTRDDERGRERIKADMFRLLDDDQSAANATIFVALCDKLGKMIEPKKNEDKRFVKDRPHKPPFPIKRDREPVVCYKCRDKGHIAKDCPKKDEKK